MRLSTDNILARLSNSLEYELETAAVGRNIYDSSKGNFQSLADGLTSNEDIQQWFMRNGRKWSINEGPVLLMDMLNPDAPDWAHSALADGSLYRIDWEQSKRIFQPIVDYFYYLQTINKSFSNISVPQATEQQEQWHQDLANKTAKNEASFAGTTPVLTLGDYHWVEVTSEEALELEGERMGHCVGSYYNEVKGGLKVIYSLRDNDGDPHVTIEKSGTTIEQIKGRANEAVSLRYRESCYQFLAHISSALTVINPDGLIEDEDSHEYRRLGIKERLKGYEETKKLFKQYGVIREIPQQDYNYEYFRLTVPLQFLPSIQGIDEPDVRLVHAESPYAQFDVLDTESSFVTPIMHIDPVTGYDLAGGTNRPSTRLGLRHKGTVVNFKDDEGIPDTDDLLGCLIFIHENIRSLCLENVWCAHNKDMGEEQEYLSSMDILEDTGAEMQEEINKYKATITAHRKEGSFDVYRFEDAKHGELFNKTLEDTIYYKDGEFLGIHTIQDEDEATFVLSKNPPKMTRTNWNRLTTLFDQHTDLIGSKLNKDMLWAQQQIDTRLETTKKRITFRTIKNYPKLLEAYKNFDNSLGDANSVFLRNLEREYRPFIIARSYTELRGKGNSGVSDIFSFTSPLGKKGGIQAENRNKKRAVMKVLMSFLTCKPLVVADCINRSKSYAMIFYSLAIYPNKILTTLQKGSKGSRSQQMNPKIVPMLSAVNRYLPNLVPLTEDQINDLILPDTKKEKLKMFYSPTSS